MFEIFKFMENNVIFPQILNPQKRAKSKLGTIRKRDIWDGFRVNEG